MNSDFALLGLDMVKDLAGLKDKKIHSKSFSCIKVFVYKSITNRKLQISSTDVVKIKAEFHGLVRDSFVCPLYCPL